MAETNLVTTKRITAIICESLSLDIKTLPTGLLIGGKSFKFKTHLEDDLHIDSVAAWDVLMELEEKLGIPLSDEQLCRPHTMLEIYQLFHGKLPKKLRTHN